MTGPAERVIAARRRGPSLAARVLGGHAAVFLAMVTAILVTAFIVGPPIFDDHMRRTGHSDQPLVLQHAAEAFRAAGLISLAVGLTIASLGAVVVSLLLTRRITEPLRAFAAATRQVAAGEYGAWTQVGGRPPAAVTAADTRELADLAASFTEMASRLAETETVRARMLADLAHEMRTPLASISVLLEAWEDGMADDVPGLVASLRQQTDRLSHLTRDIRAVSDAEEHRLILNPTASTTGAVLRRARDSARERAEQRQIQVSIAPDAALDVPVTLDENRIAQVMDNLVANALRHTPPGGTVVLGADLEVRVRRDEVLGHEMRDDEAHGDQAPGVVRIEVRDTGDGIAREHLPHLFDRFYRTDTARDRDHGGSGIGLTISRAIARAHRGSLTAASEGPGRGAVFTLRLPAS